MTLAFDTRPQGHRSATLRAGLGIAVLLAVGALAVPAAAEDHHWADHRGGRGYGGWNGGVYVAPPIVYGSPYYSPYYAPPPVVYAPGVGIAVPGVSVNIR
jgi:hypothetical protein